MQSDIKSSHYGYWENKKGVTGKTFFYYNTMLPILLVKITTPNHSCFLEAATSKMIHSNHSGKVTCCCYSSCCCCKAYLTTKRFECITCFHLIHIWDLLVAASSRMLFVNVSFKNPSLAKAPLLIKHYYLAPSWVYQCWIHRNCYNSQPYIWIWVVSEFIL